MENGLNLYVCVCVYICKLNKDHKSNLNLKKKIHVHCLFELSSTSNKNTYNYINAHMSHLMSKPGFATIFTIPTGILNLLGNETRADQTVQMYRLSFPLVVRIWHKLVFWREIKTPAHLRHCRDSSKVKSLHLGPAMSPESPAPREPGIQMNGA